MPTKPPVSLVVVARALVWESAATDTLPVAVSDAEAMYAVTEALLVTVDVLSLEPTKPPPEPVALAVETPSPGGGDSVASETPPGPTMRLPAKAVPVMLMRNWWLPLDAERSMLCGPN
jgi:hypothetical protein